MRILEELKAQLADIAELLRGRGSIIYIDIPIHLNIGDLLINAGTETFFRNAGLSVSKRYALSDFPTAPGYFAKDATLVFHGGGSFGDLWKPHQEYRERIIAMYPENRCVILPQTVHFQSSQAQAESFYRLSQHRDLHIFARDFHSSRLLREGGLNNVVAMPDMAHSLYDEFSNARTAKNGTLALMRNDREANFTDMTISAGLERIDWTDIIPDSTRAAKVLFYTAIRLSQKFGGLSAPYTQFWYPVRDRLIHRAAGQFQQYKHLVTDRLHGMLLGLLVGLDVTAFDNSYGKLSHYAESWLKGCESLDFRYQSRSHSA